MKKLFYFLSAFAGLVALASCENEIREAASAHGDTVDATFTVSASSVVTKALSDGAGATELTFAVYDEAGNYLKDLSESATKTGVKSPWTVTVPVVRDLTYQFVFIAKAATSPYAVDLTAKTVTANYGAANDDAADFFYAAKKIKIEDNLSESVALYRPLAQVNVGAADLVAAAYSLDVKNMTTGLKLTGINNVLNILDGTVSGAAEITLTEAARVNEGTTQFVSGYDRIAMGYVLVGEKQTSDATINITAKGKADGADKVITREVANIPLQANYRTNILGNIFTSSMNFTVTVMPEFAEPDINETLETNIEKANTLFAAGQTSVTVDLAPAEGGETTVILPATTEAVRLNLNITTGKTITVQYAEGAKPAKVEIYAKDIEALVADLTSSTVTITAGSHIHNGTFKTAATTLIIEATAKVDNLVVNAGATKIYGEVATISGDAAADAAFCIENLDQFIAFRDAVNAGTTYKGFNVVLENDIDLSSIGNWTPIGLGSYDGINFKGTFDGQNHSISNLKVNHVKTAGLFGCMVMGVIKNLVVDGFTVTGNHYAGGIIAWMEKGASDLIIDNCTVKNGTITSTPELVGSSYDNGDKVGGIVGYAHKPTGITNNTVEDVTITAYRHIGGVVGYSNTGTITGNTVKDVTIKQDLTNGYKAESVVLPLKGEIIGENKDNTCTIENNTVENVTVYTALADGIEINADGEYVILSKTGLESFRDLANEGNAFSGKTFILDGDIDLANEAWTPIYLSGDGTKFAGVFDGNGKTVKNLSVDLTATPAYQAAGLFGAILGTVKNLTIEGASIKNLTTGSATVNGTAVVVGSMAYGGTIEGVTVKNATVEGNRYVGGIVGYVSGTVKDCAVEEIKIIATPDNLSGSYDNGDKCGGIYGYLNSQVTNDISGNLIDGFEIKGYRDLGGIGGTALAAATLSNNVAKNGTITVDQITNSYGTKDANANELFGRANTTPTFADNTFENVEVITLVAAGVTKNAEGNYTVDGTTGAIASALDDITSDETNVNPVITVTEDAEISFGARKTYGNDDTETITIDGGGKVLRFHGTDTDWSSVGAKGATLIIKNAIIYKDEPGNGAWNNHALNLTGNVVVENVTFNNSVTVAETASFKNVNFVETGAYYTLIVKATATNVSIDNCTFTATNNGRGIKVIDQYIDEADRVQGTITISNSKFTTASKAAVLVTNTAGAKIIWGEGNDISGVAKDAVNAVWNDENRADYYDLVEVTGCTKKQE